MRMPLIDTLAYGLRPLTFGLGILAVVHLIQSGLYRRFRVLALFLSVALAQELALFTARWFSNPDRAYAWTFVASEPAVWFVYILLGLNLYSLVLQNYKGLQTVGRWIFFIALPLAILGSALTVIADLRNPRGNVILFYYVVLERGIMFSLVLFILVTLALLSWYPISISRNTMVHAIVCTVFLISASMVYFVRAFEGQVINHVTHLANLVITALCWAAWLVLLTPEGEQTEMVMRRQFTAEQEARLIDQLTLINSSLLRASRK